MPSLPSTLPRRRLIRQDWCRLSQLSRRRVDAERRQLTVMFCDLVGSTALSSRLDPEDLRGIIGAYHRCVTETVEGFIGYVARYMGDGVLIYFGYPQAHEDDAERATRCGLALVDPVPQLESAGRAPRAGRDCHRAGCRRRRRGCRARSSSAKRRTSPLACKPWPSRTLS